MREYMCITTAGYNEAIPEYANVTAPDDACFGKIVNQTAEHLIVYMGNKTACILNLPPDLRAGLIGQMEDDFMDSPINCHVFFESDETENAITAYVMLSLLLLSMLCLLATILVFALKRELSTVPGLNLMCLCLSHFVHYLTGVCNLLNLPQYTVTPWACTLFGFTRHFSILATFFWLNVMAFDIWRTITHMTNGSSHVFKWKRFIKYSLYAWGMSLSIATAAVIVDNVEGVPDYLRPSYRPPFVTDPDLRCTMTIDNLEGFLLFNTLPRIAVLVANLAFFFLTIKAIHKTSKQAEALRSTRRAKARFRLYMKLFLVMGLAWILNVVDYLIHVHQGTDWAHSGPRWFNVLTTYVTIFIGIGIYVTYGLIPSIKLIRTKCCGPASLKRPRSQLTVIETIPNRFSSNKESQSVSTKL